MAGRIRSIKPEILEDEKTAALSHLAWRLFVSLWLIADDYGNLRGDPVYVLGQTLWATRETRETIAAALVELAAVDLIVRYTVRGQGYYHVTGWAKHQKVDKPGKPRMPGPDEADTLALPEVATVRETFEESSRESRESLAPDRDLRPGPPTERSLSPAIPPALPHPEPTSVPAVSPPAPAREDIAGTQPAAESERTPRSVERDPGPREQAPAVREQTAPGETTLRANPPPAPSSADRDLAARRAVQLEVRAELERERRAVAADLGIVGPGVELLAQDPGERDLADHLVNAGPAGLARAREQALHAVKMAGLEARADRERFRWLTGAVFAERNFRRLVALTAQDARRAQKPARGGKPDQPSMPTPPKFAPTADPVLSAEDLAAMRAQAALAATAPERGREISALPTAELVKRYGDGQRAPPASSTPTNPDERTRRRKAAT